MIFSFLDRAALALHLAGMGAIEFLFAAHQSSAREFFLSGQRFGTLAMSLSVLATGLSAITFIGQPGFVVERDRSVLKATPVAVPASAEKIARATPLTVFCSCKAS